MADPITDAVTEALTKAPVADAQPPAPQPPIPPHVAANIMEFMKRVQIQGLEAYAFVEAFGHLQRFAGPAPTGPGVPFNPGK